MITIAPHPKSTKTTNISAKRIMEAAWRAGPHRQPAALSAADCTCSTLPQALHGFLRDGVVHLPAAVPASLVQSCHLRAELYFQGLTQELAEQKRELLLESAAESSSDADGSRRHHRLASLARCAFAEITRRDGLRTDLRFRMREEPFSDPALVFNERWFPLVRELLGGGDVCLLYSGVMVAETGCSQNWHSDGGHLFEHEHQPPHAINVFFALHDVPAELGPTEFQPGTHVLGRFDDESLARFALPLRAGDACLFDYRVKHRGGANVAAPPKKRMLGYLCYTKKWFRDRANTRSAELLVRELPAAGGRKRSRPAEIVPSRPWTSRVLRGGGPRPQSSGSAAASLEQQEQQGEEDAAAGDEVGTDEAHGAGETHVLFEMDVDGVGCCAGDVPKELAARFVATHGLPAFAVDALSEAIELQIAAAESTLRQ